VASRVSRRFRVKDMDDLQIRISTHSTNDWSRKHIRHDKVSSTTEFRWIHFRRWLGLYDTFGSSCVGECPSGTTIRKRYCSVHAFVRPRTNFLQNGGLASVRRKRKHYSRCLQMILGLHFRFTTLSGMAN
jgi:hypothetical protein